MATIKVDEVEVPAPPVTEKRYVLALDEREAFALLLVCNRIGGNGDNTLRGVFSDHPDSIREQLLAAGVKVPHNTDDYYQEAQAGLYFEKDRH